MTSLPFSRKSRENDQGRASGMSAQLILVLLQTHRVKYPFAVKDRVINGDRGAFHAQNPRQLG